MNLKEFFLGTQEEQEAQAAAESLRTQKKPNARHRQQLEANKKIASGIGRRRKITAMAVAAALAGTIGATTLSQNSGNADKKAISTKPVENTELTDQVIQRAEQGFTEFEARVMPLIDALPDETLRENLRAPFQVMNINKGNPNKNFPRLKAKLESRGESKFQDESQSPYIFNYIAHEEAQIAAGYNPVSKTMGLSPSFDPQSLYDFLVLFHELKHVIHDTGTRITFRSEKQFDSYANFHEGNNILINDEMDAYAYEIELLNLMAEGELKKAAEEGRDIDWNKIRQLTQNSRDLQKLEFVIELAKKYYPRGFEGIHADAKSPFVEELAKMYSQRGNEIWTRLGNGKLVKYSEFTAHQQ